MEITSGKLGSDVVRRNWRDTVDYVRGGNHVVVNLAGKPVVAIIPIEDWNALKDTLEDMHDNRLVEQSLQEDAAAGDPVAIRVLARRQEEAANATAELETSAQ